MGLPFCIGRNAKFRIKAGRTPEPAPRRNDRFAVTRGIDEFAVACDVRGSRPMGIVADLGNVYCGIIQGCSVAVNGVGRTLPLPLRPGEDSLSHPAHLRHNPPHRAALASDSGKWGGFSERASMEFDGTPG